MFVFYFGIMADLTPPVALAAFAAAPIAQESRPARSASRRCAIAIAGFVVPFMAVYAPALMLQGGSAVDVAYVVFKALIAIGLWGVGAVGYLFGPVGWMERVFAIAAASLLVAAVPWTDEAGLAMSAIFVVWQALRNRRHGAVRSAR